jgi:hypothetical protein
MHRGEGYDAAPEDYLQWLAEGNHDLSEDVRFSAGYWRAIKTRNMHHVPILLP